MTFLKDLFSHKLVQRQLLRNTMSVILFFSAFGLATEDLARHFFKAIINVKDKVSNLKQIHVVIFDVKNISTFLDSFRKCYQSFSPKPQGVLKKMSNWLGFGKSDLQFVILVKDNLRKRFLKACWTYRKKDY